MSPQSIKRIRKTLKLTQREAAALVHVSPNTWARWERGESRPRGLHQRKAIARLARSPERPNPSKLNSAQNVSKAPSKPWSTGATWLKFAGTWVGDDAERCLELVHATRGLAEF